jgi:hypothetical protein
MGTFIIILIGSSIITFVVMKVVNKRFQHWENWKRVWIAALAPSMLILILLVALHFYVVSLSHGDGSQEGFMSPLLILFYGYPIFLINLAISFAIAYSLAKAK